MNQLVQRRVEELWTFGENTTYTVSKQIKVNHDIHAWIKSIHPLHIKHWEIPAYPHSHKHLSTRTRMDKVLSIYQSQDPRPQSKSVMKKPWMWTNLGVCMVVSLLEVWLLDNTIFVVRWTRQEGRVGEELWDFLLSSNHISVLVSGVGWGVSVTSSDGALYWKTWTCASGGCDVTRCRTADFCVPIFIHW